jgi:hypothetical protein
MRLFIGLVLFLVVVSSSMVLAESSFFTLKFKENVTACITCVASGGAGDGTGGWTNTTTTTSTQRLVGVIDTTPDAQLDVQTRNATTIGLIVQGATSQSANLVEAKNTSATVFQVGANGKTVINAPYITGTPSTPSLAFGDGDTGFYEYNDDALWLAQNGANYWRWSANSFQSIGTTGTVQIANAAGTATAPVYTFTDDANTGLYRVGADSLGLTAGGVKIVTVQNASPNVQINPTKASYVPLVVKGAASQDANMMQFLNSAGTVKSYFRNDSALYIGGAAGLTLTKASDSALSVLVASTGNFGSTRALYAEINDAQSSGTPLVYGLQTTVYHGASGTASGGTATGVYGLVRQISTRPVATLSGMSFFSPYVTTTGVVTDGIGVNLQSYLSSVAVVTNYKGVNIITPSVDAGGSLTNDYGIYIQNQNKGSTLNYAIYSAGGAVEFNAGAATVVPLTVKGATSQTANLQEWKNSAGTSLAYVEEKGYFKPGTCAGSYATGEICYNTTDNNLYVYNSTALEKLSAI